MMCLLVFLSLCVAPADDRPMVLVVVGAEGTEDYGKQFRQWAQRWQTAAQRGNARFTAIGLDAPGETSDHDLLRRQVQEAAAVKSAEALWLVFIGHGTFDGKTARFNLRGPDVAAGELAAWLAASERPLAVINCASASGPFINELSGPNRVLVTATKSGFEHNFARFGDYLSAAIADPKADLDKDEQTSLLEAFLSATAGVKEFYDSDARLATEHALVDDNGDRLGTPADWFHGLRATKAAKDGAALDGLRAGQLQLVRSGNEQRLPIEVRRRRDEIEAAIARLREQKGKLPEDDYYGQLEPLLLELARLYEQAR
ncbi:MAG TPA: hypothetical protein VNH11_20295 [Pirellulales bacterium]|nr:hypothetical protein [Pirellulales bacterium]